MQIKQKHLNNPLCKLDIFSLKHSETFDISHSFLPLLVAKISMLKQVRFLLDHPVSSSFYVPASI